MDTIDTPKIETLVTLFDRSCLTELEFSCSQYSLKLKRAGSVPDAVVGVPPAPPKEQSEYEHITSPIVGTFYLTPAPDAPPYVKIGDRVKAGAVLCTIEAMKVMNQLQSQFDCEIVDILAEPEQMVECGQSLFAVKRL